MRNYMEEYQRWLDSPALSEEEWGELNAIREDEKEIRERFRSHASPVFIRNHRDFHRGGNRNRRFRCRFCHRHLFRFGFLYGFFCLKSQFPRTFHRTPSIFLSRKFRQQLRRAYLLPLL